MVSGQADWLPLWAVLNLDFRFQENPGSNDPAEIKPPISSKLQCNLMTETNTAAYVHKDAKRKTIRLPKLLVKENTKGW